MISPITILLFIARFLCAVNIVFSWSPLFVLIRFSRITLLSMSTRNCCFSVSGCLSTLSVISLFIFDVEISKYWQIQSNFTYGNSYESDKKKRLPDGTLKAFRLGDAFVNIVRHWTKIFLVLRHWSLYSVKSNRCAKVVTCIIYDNYLINISSYRLFSLWKKRGRAP